MGAVLATVPESAAEMWARGLAMTVGYALPWVGIPVVLDGNTVGIGGHLLMVDPACAAVEGLAVGIAASAAVRTLASDPARVVAGFAGAHGAAFALANLMRIASVGVALALVPESAESVHAVGGPLLLLVHAAFLARPVRRLFAQHRSPVQRRTGGIATDLALPAGPAAVASG
jgi:exosortase/archaeosortase family protein